MCADNVAPLRVWIEGPAAGLVLSTNRFRIGISGGRPPYSAIVYRGNINIKIVPKTFVGFYCDYVVPDEPKQEMIECIVTDTDPYTNIPPESIMTVNRAHAEIPFWQVKLTLKRDDQEITGAVDVWAGQKVHLSSEILPLDAPVSYRVWRIPGRCVDSYTSQRSSGSISELIDFSAEDIELYWIDGDVNPGAKKTTSLDATVKGTILTIDCDFMVKTPEYYEFPLYFGPVSVGYLNTSGGAYGLWKGAVKDTPSPRWDGFEHMGFNIKDAGFDVMFVQVIRYSYAVIWIFSIPRPLSYPRPQLDDDFIQAACFNDTPGVRLLSVYNRAECGDNFCTYFMCKPPGDDSIWIPLKKWEWAWDGAAVPSINNTFVLDSYQMNLLTYPATRYQLEPPEWTGYVPAR